MPRGGVKVRGRLAAGGLAVLALLPCACLVSIRHVADAQGEFLEARAEAERYQGRPGPAHRINLLVFDPEERKLVRLSLPIWLAGKIAGHIDLGGEEGGRALERSVGRAMARRIRVEDLDDAGLGLLADVEDDDGQVLVWLR
jgi:hypothetical protein